jgi:hypothetical protein
MVTYYNKAFWEELQAATFLVKLVDSLPYFIHRSIFKRQNSRFRELDFLFFRWKVPTQVGVLERANPYQTISDGPTWVGAFHLKTGADSAPET